MAEYLGREPHIEDGPMLSESETDGTTEVEDENIEDVVEDDELEDETDEVDADDEDADDEAEEEPDPEVARYKAFHDHLQTSDGALDFTVEALLSLGYDLDAVEDILTRVPGNVDRAVLDDDDDDDDRVLTVKDLKELERRQNAARAEEIREERAAEEAAALQTLVVSTIGDFRLDGEPLTAKEARAVTAYADEHLAAKDYGKPDAIKRALRLGLKDLEEVTGKRSARTVAAKTAAKKRVPKAVKGGTPGGESESEPTGVDDAIKRARRRLRANGTITD